MICVFCPNKKSLTHVYFVSLRVMMLPLKKSSFDRINKQIRLHLWACVGFLACGAF